MTAVFAHRGATEHYPENTVAAFTEARRLGVDGVELDVRRSADGALVIHHDEEIEGLGALSGLTVAQLPATVPLLAEALDACEGLTVNVEIKNSPGEAGYDPTEAISVATAAAIADAGWRERVVVSSFSRSCLDAVRVADPSLVLGWLLDWTADGAECLRQAVAAGYDAIHPFVTQADEALVSSAHAAGLAVNVWTVNAPSDLAAMATLGVDAVITDRPVEALAAVRGT